MFIAGLIFKQMKGKMQQELNTYTDRSSQQGNTSSIWPLKQLYETSLNYGGQHCYILGDHSGKHVVRVEDRPRAQIVMRATANQPRKTWKTCWENIPLHMWRCRDGCFSKRAKLK